MKPLFIHPTKPFVITQNWGVRNTVYDQFGFKRHNGVDFRLGKDAKLIAPHDGEIISVGYQDKGAGHYIEIVSKNKYTFPDGQFYIVSCLMHLEKPLVKAGTIVKQGDIVAIADNTGFSTGPHTHWRLRRLKLVKSKYVNVDKNDANDSVDPMPFVRKTNTYKFKKDLSVGMTDPDVKELQKYFNANGFTVSNWFAGSPGNETDYFGEKTRVALATFQATYNIDPPQGYFGEKTRAFINAS